MKTISILLCVAIGVMAFMYVFKFIEKAYKDALADRFLISLKMNLSRDEYETVAYLVEKAYENMSKQSNK